MSFDIPHLAFFTGYPFDYNKVSDTVVLSYLYNPALEGGHSLEAYGGRLRYPKVEHTDWTKYSEEMLHRCEVDVNLLELVHDALLLKFNKLHFSELSAEIEHKIRVIIDQQQKTGFYFDQDRGRDLLVQLNNRLTDLAAPIQKLFPPKLEKVGEYTRRKRKDGSDFASFEKHVRNHDRVLEREDGTYETYDFKPFNISSPKQRLERLLGLGYKPTAKTPKGNPKIDEDSLLAYAELSGLEEVRMMAEYLVTSGQAGMVQTWLDYVKPDSRIHGKVISCGATTRRMTHNSPNCVPMYSQALTRNGWKSASDLVVGEDILAYDLSTKTKKWTPLLGVSAFQEAEVYSFGQKNPRKRLYCTKNHSWVTRPRDVSKKYEGPEKLVEAQYLKHNKPIRINASFDNDVTESDFSLIQEKYSKDWVSEICKLSDPELHAMMQGFLLADGCVPKHKKQWEFAQAEGPLLDTFLTLFYLVSDTRISAVQKRKLRGENQRMGYTVNKTQNAFMRTKDMSLKYEGIEPVWCPTTVFGTWVMKQGDFITITGNTANIPSGAKAKYGHECRSLWTVEPNKGLIQVGVDAAGLENTGLLHYLNNPKATFILQQPKPNDVHSMNARTLTELLKREVDREWGAKTSWFAFIYGAYPPKLGSIVKGPPSDGELIMKTFFKNVPGLERLIKDVQTEWDQNGGLLRCIDGGFVRCPGRNAALNYRIQSLGAIVMKLAAILLDQHAKEIGLWFNFIGNIHDEWQMETKEEDGKRLGELAVSCISEAAVLLKFNVPLSGEYKLGKNWSETH